MVNTPTEKASSEAEDIYSELLKKLENEFQTTVKTKIIEGLADIQKDLKRRDRDFLGVNYGGINRNLLNSSNLFGRFMLEYAEIQRSIENARHSLERPFSIFVLGTGNYGKSALINSLLGTGKRIATENFKPMTWKIDVYGNRLDENKKNTLLRYTERQVWTTIAQAQNVVNQEEENSKRASQLFAKKKRQWKSEGYTIAEFTELMTKYKREELYCSDLVEVQWPVGGSEILQRFTIVDTPGLKQDLTRKELKNSAKDYYFRANGVLWLLDATAIDSSTTRKEIDDIIEEFEDRRNENSLLRNKNVIGVLNKIDLIPEEQRESVLRKAKQNFGKYFTDIVPYSAKKVFDAQVSNDTGVLEKYGFYILQDSIQRVFFNRSVELQIGTTILNVQKSIDKLLTEINTFNRELRDKCVTIQSYEAHVDNYVNELQSEINLFIEENVQLIWNWYESNLMSAVKKIVSSSDTSDANQEVRRFLNPPELTEMKQKLYHFLLERAKETGRYLISKYKISEYKHLDKRNLANAVENSLLKLSINGYEGKIEVIHGNLLEKRKKHEKAMQTDSLLSQITIGIFGGISNFFAKVEAENQITEQLVANCKEYREQLYNECWEITQKLFNDDFFQKINDEIYLSFVDVAGVLDTDKAKKLLDNLERLESKLMMIRFPTTTEIFKELLR